MQRAGIERTGVTASREQRVAAAPAIAGEDLRGRADHVPADATEVRMRARQRP